MREPRDCQHGGRPAARQQASLHLGMADASDDRGPSSLPHATRYHIAQLIDLRAPEEVGEDPQTSPLIQSILEDTWYARPKESRLAIVLGEEDPRAALESQKRFHPPAPGLSAASANAAVASHGAVDTADEAILEMVGEGEILRSWSPGTGAQLTGTCPSPAATNPCARPKNRLAAACPL